MKTIVTITILLLSLLACITPKKGPRKAFAGATELVPFDAIIVPGVPFNGQSWDSMMKARVLWSYILYKNGYARNIIYSGGAVYTSYYEAQVMGLYAQALGIPEQYIYYDTIAKHSTENVYYSYLLAKRVGFKTIALATDPFQSAMLRTFTRKRFGSPIYHLPFIKDSLAIYSKLDPQIDTTPSKAVNWISIKEKQSWGKRLLGTMGQHINWKEMKDGQVDAL